MKKLIILIIVACIVGGLSKSNEYVEIPSTSIRMRVIANSNSEVDQSDKKIIKSILEEKLYDIVKKTKKEDIDSAIMENKENIDKSIENVIKEKKMNLSFSSNYGINYFPEKEFKGLIYKSGNYKSYVVTLGEGKGDNWWCVLYPPLCLVDENKSDYEYHYLIKDTIDKYN